MAKKHIVVIEIELNENMSKDSVIKAVERVIDYSSCDWWSFYVNNWGVKKYLGVKTKAEQRRGT